MKLHDLVKAEEKIRKAGIGSPTLLEGKFMLVMPSRGIEILDVDELNSLLEAIDKSGKTGMVFEQYWKSEGSKKTK